MTAKFPITGEIAGDLIGMTSAELKLCRTTREETVAVFSDTRTNPELLVSAFLASAKELADSCVRTKDSYFAGWQRCGYALGAGGENLKGL